MMSLNKMFYVSGIELIFFWSKANYFVSSSLTGANAIYTSILENKPTHDIKTVRN